MNTVILMGRLTKDPEISSSTSGTSIARYSIAVDRKYKKDGEPTADFFSCVSFGKQADFVSQYLKKGTKIVVSGSLQNNAYTNKEGQKVHDVRVIVNDVEFAESKGEKKEETKDDFLKVPIGIDLTELPFS